MRCQCALLVTLLLIKMNSILGNGTYQPCNTPQYVEFGTKGTVHCNFAADFFGIYWYNTTDHVNDFSLINIKNPGYTKSGPGFISGDFDVNPNGSLIIKKVNFGNAHNYTVVKLDSPTDEIIPHYVEVIVVALPTPPYPVIEGCTSQQGCEMKVDQRGNLTCSLKGITPPVDLEWRSIEDDSSVTFIRHQQSKTRSEDGRYHVVLTSVFHLESTLDYSSNVTCRVVVPEEGPKLDLRSSVYLFSIGEPNGRATSPNGADIKEFPVIAVIVPVVAVVIIVIITSVVFMIVRWRERDTELDTERTERLDAPPRKKKVKKEELVPLLESKAKADRFKQHLETTYKEAFGSLRVISTIKDDNDTKQTTEIIKTEFTMETEPKDNVKHVENGNFLTDGGNNNDSIKQVDEKSTVEEGYSDAQLQTSDLDSKKPEVKILSQENTITASNTMNATDKDEADSSGYIENKLLIEPVIQVLNIKPGTVSQGVWKNVESVGNLLIESSNESKFFIVEGEFGHGLSTISKLLAREWSNEDSELAKCFNVLVVLKCNEISGDQSIHAEIKRLLVETDPKFTENDIEGVLCDEHNKVALVLDGSNMYTSFESKINGDLKRIITREIMKECTVIVINSIPCALNELKDVTRLRALDLNEKDQEVLIREEMVCRDAGTKEQIRTFVQENLLLKDILRVPFFFLFFLRRASTLTNLPKVNSVTKFFSWIISELRQCHTEHRKYSEDVWEDETVAQLGKLAFEALTSSHKWGKNWTKSEVLTCLKEDTYECYKQMGIICEETLHTLDSSSVQLENGSVNLEVLVTFTHPILYEWYAAQHLKSMFQNKDSKYLEGVLNILESTDCWYCLRFFCGIALNDHSRKVCETVEHEVLQLLCKIESKEELTNIEDTLKKGWPKQMSLSAADSRVQQLATVQLLEVGSKKELQSLKLENCFNSVKDGFCLLELKSGVELPTLASLKHLDVIEEGRELTNEETTGILKFVLKCTKLKHVRFSHCFLPQTLDDITFDSTTKSKDVKVQWIPNKDSSETYSLDWKTCTWKESKGVIVDDYVYKKLVTNFRKKHGIRFDVKH